MGALSSPETFIVYNMAGGSSNLLLQVAKGRLYLFKVQGPTSVGPSLYMRSVWLSTWKAGLTRRNSITTETKAFGYAQLLFERYKSISVPKSYGLYSRKD